MASPINCLESGGNADYSGRGETVRDGCDNLAKKVSGRKKPKEKAG